MRITERPASASRYAVTEPPNPEPITTASTYSGVPDAGSATGAADSDDATMGAPTRRMLR